MQLTQQQSNIISHVAAPTSVNSLTLVSSVAGSGKTTLLRAIADHIPHSNALYISYNSALAKEATKKFPKSVDCRTIHSIAHRALVKELGLSVGFFNPRNMDERWTYDEKQKFIDIFNEFCLSEHTDFDDFLTSRHYSKGFSSTGHKYLDRMHQGKMECTHDFYLKLFHIMLDNGTITYPAPFDLILFDEIQDMALVSTRIFELLPATRKVGVGDKHQAIYSFNHTVNYFELAPSDATIFFMTQSFRVPAEIGLKIHAFCTRYIEPTMSFQGTPVTDYTIHDRAYITRTNSALINKMIELNATRTPYTLIRKPEEIFKLPLILCGLKYKGFISAPEHRYLQDAVNEWYEEPTIRELFKTPISYISSQFAENDLQLKQAIRLLAQHGAATIISTYEAAKSHVGSKSTYTLCSSHSSKGLQWDEVTLADDMNDSIASVIDRIDNPIVYDSNTDTFIDRSGKLSTADLESLNLYYVACSRAAKRLYNAQYLN